MTKKQIVTVTDLGGGDGGKGGVVHKVCCALRAHTVLKVGGAQGSHGVRTSRGQKFNFSQFGCGTFEGVKTHITDLMVVEPYGFMHEANLLRYDHGIREILDMVTVDKGALCITPFHTFASQLQELARKERPKGTIGLGAGVAVLDAQTHPETTIRGSDLLSPGLRDKLAAIRERMIEELAPIVANKNLLWERDREIAEEIIRNLNDESLVDRVVKQFALMGESVRITGEDHLKDILAQEGTIVVESSHGVLTDRYYGFHPNVSRLRTVPPDTWKMLENMGYDGQVFKLGVSRAYAIRHGAGPMVTEEPHLVNYLLPGSHKDNNRWQGKVRVGPLDFVALRYALNCCGGARVFDGLAITWLDQIPVYGQWKVCNAYEGVADAELFTPEGEIRVMHSSDNDQVIRQERLGKALEKCCPVVTTHDVSGMGTDTLVKLCQEELLEKLEVPVRMVSLGPTEEEKRLF